MSQQTSTSSALTPGERLAAYMKAMDVGNRALRSGELSLAGDSFAEAAQLRPEMFQPHIMLGTVLRSKDDFVGALDAFQNALRLQPKNADLLCQIGEMLYSQKLYVEALVAFNEAVISDDRYTTAICGLAEVLTVLDQHAEALDLLRAAVEREPKRPELWSSLGVLCHKAGNAQLAEVFYDEALRLLPDIEPAKGNLELIRQTRH